MKVLLRGPTRAELEEHTRELRLQRWRRRPVAALVTAALAAGCVMPVAAVAEPGGWDGGVGSSSPSSQESSSSSSSSSGGGSSIGSSSPSSQESSSSSSSSSSSDSSDSGSVSSPSEAADAAGPSSSAADSSSDSSDSDSDGGWDGSVGSSSPSSQESNDGGSISSPTEAADAAPGPSASDTDSDDDSGWDGTVGSSSPSSQESTSSSESNDGGAISSPTEAADAAPAGTVGSSSPSSQESTSTASDDASQPAVTAMGDVAAPGDTTTTTTTAPAAEAEDDGWDGEVGLSSPSSQESKAPAATAPEEDTSTPVTTPMGDVAAPPSHAGPVGEAAEDTTTTTAAPETQPAADYEAPATTPMGDIGGPYTAPAEDEGTPIGPSSPSSQERNEAPDTMAPSNAPTQSTSNNRPGASEEDADDEPAYEGPAYTPMGDVGMPGPEASYAPELTEQGTVETTVDGPEVMSERELGLDNPAYTPNDSTTDLPVPGTANTTPAQPSTDGFGVSATAAFGLGGTVGFARDEDHTAITVGIAEGYGLFGSAGQEDAPETPLSAQSAVMGAIGPFSLSGEVGTDSGITGTFEAPIEMNPGVAQTQQYSFNLNHETGLTTESTEGMAFGAQEGVAMTHSVTVSIPNDTIETVGSWFGLSEAPDPRNGRITGGGF
ncbi:hypothetical protein OJ998_19325 [Solirubrobacter taibaiensis]|nr:hypothetical protein [Solirubrobacter taibaiensis]